MALALPAMPATRAGQYRVRVTSAYSTVHSEPATLVVVPSLAVATEFLKNLGDYGVTAAKLTNLRKKIDTARELGPQPRLRVLDHSVTNKALAVLVRQANGILRDRLDKLVVQFKETNPDFFNTYKAARVVVDYPATHGSPAEAPAVTTLPAPLAKAA